MKIGFWVALLFALFDICIVSSPAECFTIPVSVSTGMAIIIALVKVKAIIVKVLLGLKAMGYDSFVWRTSRRRRRRDVNNNVNINDNDTIILKSSEEILSAWNDLQETLGRIIEFDLSSCLKAAAGNSINSQRLISTSIDLINVQAISKEHINKKVTSSRDRDLEYSQWVSKILGSTIGDKLACELLNEALKNRLDIKSFKNITPKLESQDQVPEKKS